MNDLNVEDVNRRDEHNRTLLHNNVFEDRLANVKSLLKKDADVSLMGTKGNTPLHTAAVRKYPHMIEALLKFSSRDKLKRFIDAKTTVTGSSALHVAACMGCLESVKHLLSYGANFEVKNNAGKRPLDVAIDLEVKNLLVNVEMDSKLAAQGKYRQLHKRMLTYSKDELNATTLARNNQGHTSLQLAVIGNHCNTVQSIFDVRIDRLHKDKGTNSKYFEVIDQLIINGKKVSDGQSVIMIHSQDHTMVDNKTLVEEIAEALEAAYNIVKIAESVPGLNEDEPYDRPSLLAVVEETLEALEFKPEHIEYDEKGRILFSGLDARYCRMLKPTCSDGTIDKNKVISYMGTLQVAVTQAIAMFLRPLYTVQLSIAAENNDVPMFEQCINEQFVDVNVINEDQCTPMHFAANNGNEEMIAKLLRKSALINIQTKSNKETALHLASGKGHERIVKKLLQTVTDDELETYVDMQTQNEGWSALHFAAQGGHIKVIELLLVYGATYNLPGKDYKTPEESSEHARVKQFLEMVDAMFTLAKDGDKILLRHLIGLQDDQLLAVGNARNKAGLTLEKVAVRSGHRDLAMAVSKIMFDVTPASPKTPTGPEYDDAYCEILLYQLMETLANSPT